MSESEWIVGVSLPALVRGLLALGAAGWHNWNIGATSKRSLIAYHH